MISALEHALKHTQRQLETYWIPRLGIILIPEASMFINLRVYDANFHVEFWISCVVNVVSEVADSQVTRHR